MSGRPIMRDIICRGHTSCRSCLSRLTKYSARPWGAAYSTRMSNPVAERRARLRSRKRETSRPTKEELEKYWQGLKDIQNPVGKNEEKGNFSVRFFEQDELKREELPDEAAFEESFGRLHISELRDTLSELQKSLNTQEEREAFRDVLKEMGDWDKAKSADDVEQMITRMEAYTKLTDAKIKDIGFGLPESVLDELIGDLPDLSLEEALPSNDRVGTAPQIAIHDWTTNQRRKVKKLNFIISAAFRESKEKGLKAKTAQSLYKAYHSTRVALSQNWRSVPLDVWEFLWTIFSAEETKSTNRMTRISSLARDMVDAKVTLSPLQQVLTIEALFVEGFESNAIENWKRCQSTMGTENSESFQDFWELGARMFCQTGDLGQAERAINKLLDHHLSPRILMTLIRTSCEQGTTEGQARAWAAYRQMRGLLHKEMKLSDYDQVISYFLTAHHVESALYVFVDMMSDGQIDMAKQSCMPSVIANKYFLGKWMKRLIGAGDLDGAFSVVKFMQSKGVQASPIHLNGLIGAWQRSGGAEDLEKAEKLGWRMIESRTKFVANRKAATSITLADVKSTDWPRATLETFSLLAENYRQRNLHSQLERLWDGAHGAEINPDAFMMNQFLESLIQGGDHKQALALYHSLVGSKKVAPDPYTFSALWKTLAINRAYISSDAIDGEIEATRAMFKETVKHRTAFKPDGMDGQLARKILHTIRRLKDDNGFLVALTALKDIFKFLPPETLVMELVLNTSRLTWDTPAQRNKVMRAKRDMDMELLAWAEFDPVKLEGEKRSVALYEYLQKLYWPALGTEKDKRKHLVEVAKEMGVLELLKRPH